MQSSYSPEHVLTREFFTAPTDAQAYLAMDERKAELQKQGHTRFERTKIGRNATCPCGSGSKFKRCCMAGAMRVNRR